ncbi:hypothetical protein [Trinickia diaoshuihuensis]|uniref:hypothetical protein n=1 Tax=Trinickia diaoshuihuensis TaxID=2292265 RepID=UPI0013C30A08|nr:hypothetical protein [Trinickia diaoshuihuensis]
MRRPKLLLSAEPFGYGPAGKLLSIVERLRGGDFHLSFLGGGTAMTAVRMNQGFFDTIVELEAGRIHEHEALIRGCDAILSVMEPALVIAGYAHRKTTLYVDSLSFLWRSSIEREMLEKLSSELPGAPALGYELANDMPMHDAQALAHYLAHACFIQRYSNLNSTIAIANPREIDAIVPRHGEPVACQGCDLLVSLSGQLSAFADAVSSLDYANLVIDLCERIRAKAGGDTRIDIAVNPAVRKLIPQEQQRRFNMCSLDHRHMNEKVRTCTLLLAPPGLTTALESIFHGTPYLLLPDQHYAHHLNRMILDPAGQYAALDFGTRDLPRDPRAATRFLQERAKSQLTSPEFDTLADAAAERVCELLFDAALRAAAIRAQRAQFDACIGGFDGATHVTNEVKQLFALA